MPTQMKRTKKPKQRLDLNSQRGQAIMRALSSEIISRSGLAASLGQQFGGDRDIYEACGYKKTLVFKDYMARYSRQDVAKRIVNAYPNATWALKPTVLENDDPEETTFEKAWNEWATSTNLYHYIRRADRLSGIGKYGVLFLGFNDGKDFEEPCEHAKELLYQQPFTQNHAGIKSYVTQQDDPRFGLPEFYELQFQVGSVTRAGSRQSSSTRKVHWSRVLHLAEERQESEVFGTPRLEAVFNRLFDIEKTVGGAAEMFWRGGFPGFLFAAKEGFKFNEQTLAALKDEIEDYVHKLNRYMRVRGVDAEQMEQQIASPKDFVMVELLFISIATGIPVRILTGSERGELASSQDIEEWNGRVQERREDYAGPMILRPLIDRLISVGVLPPPQGGYSIEWDEPDTLTAQDKSEVAKNIAEAVAKYAGTPGTEMVLPLEVFLGDVLTFDPEKVQAIVSAVRQELGDEADEEEARQRMRKEIEEEIREQMGLDRQQEETQED